jgi:hypothetical protein
MAEMQRRGFAGDEAAAITLAEAKRRFPRETIVMRRGTTHKGMDIIAL